MANGLTEPGVEVIQPGTGQPKDRPRHNRDQTYGERTGGHEPQQHKWLRPSIRDTAAEPVSGSQIKQDQANQARPDDERVAEPGIEQPRCAELNAQRGESSREDERQQIEPAEGAGSRARGHAANYSGRGALRKMTGKNEPGVWPLWQRLLVLAAIAVALAVPMLLWRDELSAVFANREQVVEEIRGAGAWGPVVLIVLVIGQTIVAPIPGQVINFVAGYIYGPWAGMLYSWLGMVAGIGIAMAIGRYAGRPVVERLIGSAVMEKMDQLAAGKGVAFFLLMFIIPGLPDDVLCFIVGMTALPLRLMWPLAAVARIPGLLAAVVLGAQAENIPLPVWIAFSGLGLVGLVMIWRYGDRVQSFLMHWLGERAEHRG
jgi:uncharacterized membrane protein YdjX (TVP38/TMEM64 family)